MLNRHAKHQPDYSYLIAMVGDDRAFLINFFENFILQMPIYLAEMNDAVLELNWSKVADCAHKIKPTLSYIGRIDVRDLVQAIEDGARDKIALDKIPLDMENLKLVFSDIFLQLEQEKIKLTTKR